MSHPEQFSWQPSRPTHGGRNGEPPAGQPPLVTLVVVLAALNVVTLVALAGLLTRDWWYGAPLGPRPITPRQELWEVEKQTIDLYNRVRPSVVHITTLRTVRREGLLNAQA